LASKGNQDWKQCRQLDLDCVVVEIAHRTCLSLHPDGVTME